MNNESIAEEQASPQKRPRWYGAALAPGAPADLRSAAMQRVSSIVRACRGNVTRAAHALGVSRSTLVVWAQRNPELRATIEQAREVHP